MLSMLDRYKKTGFLQGSMFQIHLVHKTVTSSFLFSSVPLLSNKTQPCFTAPVPSPLGRNHEIKKSLLDTRVMDLPKVSRKISLFSILLFLLVLITVNILLTAWIILTLRINFQGQQKKLDGGR